MRKRLFLLTYNYADLFVALRPEFFHLLIYGNFFSDLGSGDEKNKKALKMSS